MWAEIRDDLVPIVEQAHAGRSLHMDDITLIMERHGDPEETHFAFSYTPVRDEAGAVAGFFCPCMEITGQVMAELRLATETVRQRRLFEQAPGFITILHGPEHVFEFVNKAYLRLFGERDFVGKTIREAFRSWPDKAFTSGSTTFTPPASASSPMASQSASTPCPMRSHRSDSSTSSTSRRGRGRQGHRHLLRGP